MVQCQTAGLPRSAYKRKRWTECGGNKLGSGQCGASRPAAAAIALPARFSRVEQMKLLSCFSPDALELAPLSAPALRQRRFERIEHAPRSILDFRDAKL